MEAYAFDSETAAALFKLRGAVAGAHGAKIWKERTLCWPAVENRFNLAAESHKGKLA
jgi:hypothetical protein